MNDSNEFLLNQKTLRLTMYLSLAIANIIFGALYPDHIVVAGCGFAFFSALILLQLRSEAAEKESSAKKALHFDK
ncbi:MAG: hypothetical protein AAGC78_13015 [Cellvibrio sp.]|uniref:hypothetical protein n=1 Tax=Cellvibrio sp. TaxID=1965322 RepID=UPI0031B0CE00